MGCGLESWQLPLLLDPGGSSSRVEMRACVCDPWSQGLGEFISERGLSLSSPPHLYCSVKENPKFRSMVEAGEGEGWDDRAHLEISKRMFSSSRWNEGPNKGKLN